MTSVPLTSAVRIVALSALLALFPLSSGSARTFELDIKELDKTQPSRKESKKHASPKIHSSGASKPATTRSTEPLEGGEQKYTVKPGDHIFKILMKELGLSNDEAERLLPDVAKLNNLKDVRKLSVGQVLILPSTMQRTRKQQIVKQEPSGEARTRKKKPAPAVNAAPASELAREEAPVVSAVPASEPAREEAPVEAKAPAPAVQPAPERQAPPQASTSLAHVRVLAISSSSTEEMIDSLLNALGLNAEKKRIIETSYGGSTGSILSIKVDRYFEESGKRFIVNCTPKDQFNYTLLRLLEREGYKVIQAEQLDFRKLADTLLGQLGRQHDYMVRKEGVEAGRELPGYLVGDGKAEMQLFLTDSAVK